VEPTKGRMRRITVRAARVFASVFSCAAVLVTAGCASHHPATLMVTHAASGDRASFAGVALTVPKGWRIRHGPPSFCGPIVGRTAYFSVGTNSPAMGCSSSLPTNRFLSVRCHPYPDSEPPPTGKTSSVGSFAAIVTRDSPSPNGVGGTSIFLVGRDIQIDIWGTSATTRAIESSIHHVSGTC